LKALTGRSVSIYIRTIRLHRAKEMLQSTDLNISEIAYEVGFKDPSYFTRQYREEFGITPSQTRK
jgi:AraC-like DNA-binding protein